MPFDINQLWLLLVLWNEFEHRHDTQENDYWRVPLRRREALA